MPKYNPVADNHPDPYPIIADDRGACPVAYIEEAGFYQVTSYQAISEVLRNPVVYSSRYGVTASGTGEEEHVLAFADPPEHTRQRRLLVKAFSPARIEALTPHIREIANDLIDQLAVTGGRFDLVDALANPLPLTVICELLGVPDDRHEDFRRWTEASEAAASVEDASEFLPLLAELRSYVLDQVIERNAMDTPPDDLITALAFAEVEGERFADAEVAAMVDLLLTAGNSTTENLVCNLVFAIESHPEQKAKLLESIDALLPGVVDEGLRFDGPIHGLFRTATRDTVLDGVAIPEGSMVFCCYGAGSHDPAVFADPDSFIVDRDWPTLPSHLGFGMGIHHCIGSNLARTETRIALEVLYKRLPGLCLEAGFHAEQEPGLIFRSWKTIRLTYDGPVGPRTDGGGSVR